MVFGAIVLTAEYSTGMIRTSLTAMPRRVTVYAAKALVFAIVALVVTLVAAFIAFFLGQALLASTHANATLSEHDVLRAVIGSALYVTLCGLFAFAAGAIFRHTAATITSIIGLLFVIPILAHLLPSSWYNDVARWLPDSAGGGHIGHGGAAGLAPVLPVGSVHRVRRLHGHPAGRGRDPVPQARRLAAHAGRTRASCLDWATRVPAESQTSKSSSW